ncbi:MAG: T9SS type A sorting domain-containing protein [Bacteroidetes bacterium]|nr:T9SS type A sorting domain-containing protein [Bacteroidota bacterium]
MQNVNPSGYNTAGGDPAVNDILFVSSSVVLAVTGGDNGGASGKGHVWRSTDGGASWTNVSPTGFSCGNSIAKGTNGTSNVIYIGTGLSGSMADPGTLWKSADDGLTWTVVNYGPTATNNPSVSNLPIYDVAVDPRGTDTLYLACGSNLDYAFVRSTDGGTTYQNINATGEGAFTSVTINQTYPDSVYTAIRRDILVYDATTDSAMYIYRGLPGELVPDLAFGSVLAGTSMGFFRVEAEPLIPTSVSPVSTYNKSDLVIFPNPVKDEATLGFQLDQTGPVTINVYDVLGNIIITKRIAAVEMGHQFVKIDTHELSAGTYVVSLNKGNGRVSRMFIRISE